MKVSGRHTRTIWVARDGVTVEVIDQTRLPHHFMTRSLGDLAQAADAIRHMVVRGAPLIGATAAYGMALAMRHDAGDSHLEAAARSLLDTRPTAVNLRWVVEDMLARLRALDPAERAEAAYRRAADICDEDVAMNEAIGRHGLALIRRQWAQSGGTRPVQVLTHCNAGWLATVDWGTALAPVYMAFDEGIDVHVWVDETRPRNQGSSLTAWELGEHGVEHTIVTDNAGGHLMQRGMVDLCITGTDRTTASGDVCNKIGTYLKALAARDNGVPFYVGAPSPSIDWRIDDGLGGVPIEERGEVEVREISGRNHHGDIVTISITPERSRAANYAFDITPARLVTGLITERGICDASRQGLQSLFPERSAA